MFQDLQAVEKKQNKTNKQTKTQTERKSLVIWWRDDLLTIACVCRKMTAGGASYIPTNTPQLNY